MNNREQMYANPYSKVLLRRLNRKPVILVTGHAEKANMIIAKVAKYFNISFDDMLSNKRIATIVTARNIAIFLLKTRLDFKLKQIGKIFDKDHSTIIYSINSVYDRKYIDKHYANTLDSVEKLI